MRAGAERSPAPGDDRRRFRLHDRREHPGRGARGDRRPRRRVRPGAGAGHADLRGRLHRLRQRGGPRRDAAGGGVPGRVPHVPRLRPDREPGREAPPDARRAGAHPGHLPADGGRRGRRAGRPALRQPLYLPRPRGHQDGRSVDPRRRQGPHARRDLRERPGRGRRQLQPPREDRGRAGGERAHPAREGRGPARRPGRDGLRGRPPRPRRPRRGGPSRRRRDRGGGVGPAQPPSLRQGGARRVRFQDRAPRGRRRLRPHLRVRGGGRGARRRALLRLAPRPRSSGSPGPT